MVTQHPTRGLLFEETVADIVEARRNHHWAAYNLRHDMQQNAALSTQENRNHVAGHTLARKLLDLYVSMMYWNAEVSLMTAAAVEQTSRSLIRRLFRRDELQLPRTSSHFYLTEGHYETAKAILRDYAAANRMMKLSQEEADELTDSIHRRLGHYEMQNHRKSMSVLNAENSKETPSSLAAFRSSLLDDRAYITPHLSH